MPRKKYRHLRPATPAELIRTLTNLNLLWAETCSVMTMRMLGIAGFWPVTTGENRRMMMEKPVAFAGSLAAAGWAAAQGKRPDQVVDIAVARLRRKTRANTRRLVKRGMTT